MHLSDDGAESNWWLRPPEHPTSLALELGGRNFRRSERWNRFLQASQRYS